VAVVGAANGHGAHAVTVLAAELGVEAEVVVQTRAALPLLHIRRAVALARHLVAAARDAVAPLAGGKAVVAGLAAAALTADHVRLAFAGAAELGALAYSVRREGVTHLEGEDMDTGGSEQICFHTVRSL